jgi:transposase
MRHVEGANRHQATLLPETLEDFVAVDHPVRVIDAYIDTLDLKALGFSKAVTKDTGRKPYHPGDLLKLYVYGYLNKVTTSRRLETECHRNLEVLWLMKRLAPDYKTIADFRKDNGRAVRGTCRSFIQFCREVRLLSGRLVAIDGSKFKAAASKDQVLTQKQLKRDRAKIEQQVEHYLARLDEADAEEQRIELEHGRVADALQTLKTKGQRLDDREQIMDAMGRNDHCATELDARLMRSGRDGMVLGYNVQTAVEAETGLIVHHEVTDDPGDTRQLQPMAEQAKAELGVEQLEVLADGGYSNGGQLAACEQQGITATLPRRLIRSRYKDFYQKSDFDYNAKQDSYRCPAGEVLQFQRADKRHKYYAYVRSGCDQCSLQPRCTTADTRTITRHFHEDAFERSQARLQADPSLMRQRMAIAERPYAMLKQAMALRRFTCYGIEKVRCEMAIGVLAYNLNRMISRIGVPRMLALIGQ